MIASPLAGAGHAAERAVRVGAAADQRAVADAAGPLADHAAGRRGGRDRAVAVERDGARPCRRSARHRGRAAAPLALA